MTIALTSLIITNIKRIKTILEREYNAIFFYLGRLRHFDLFYKEEKSMRLKLEMTLMSDEKQQVYRFTKLIFTTVAGK